MKTSELIFQGYHKVSNSVKSELSGTAPAVSLKDLGTIEGEATLQESTSFDSSQKTDNLVNIDSSNGRVMLIDGTSIIYRSYYKLLGKILRRYNLLVASIWIFWYANCFFFLYSG